MYLTNLSSYFTRNTALNTFTSMISFNSFNSLLRGIYHHFTGEGTMVSQGFLKDT